MIEFGGLGLGYLAGVLSTLSPCVLPLLPIVLLGAFEQHAGGPIALAAGLSLSFAMVGTLVAAFGFALGLDPGALRLVVAVLLIGAGLVLLVPVFQARLAMAAGPAVTLGHNWLDKVQPSGLGGQFLLGSALGVIWAPCVGPTLGAAVGLAASADGIGPAAAVMAAFGLGAATPVVALAYGSRHAMLARRDRMAQWSRLAKPVTGIVLLLVGAFVATGLDKTVETALTRAMPDWLLALTTRF